MKKQSKVNKGHKTNRIELKIKSKITNNYILTPRAMSPRSHKQEQTYRTDRGTEEGRSSRHESPQNRQAQYLRKQEDKIVDQQRLRKQLL